MEIELNAKSKITGYKNLFDLDDVGKTLAKMSAFGQKLISNLGDDVFQITTRQELLFRVLKQIIQVRKNVKLDDASIEKACGVIIKHFRLDLEAKIQVHTSAGLKEIKSEKQSYTTKFCKIILQIDKVPKQLYDQILSDVNRDLFKVSELIKSYETQNCIQNYLRHNEVPKNHEDRIIFDFYKRCLAERIEILNYQLFGVKERALFRAKPSFMGLAALAGYFENMNDRPYYFAKPFANHYFDWKQIDLAGHRLGEFTFEKFVALKKLYLRNKAQFYRRYFKQISIAQHFQNYNYYLPLLPLKNNRKPIFDELTRLFKAKRWISFYALALPQVEGLFSEMCLAVSPENDLSQKSLTHKVNSLRPFHKLSKSYFDYYQYYIPLQRNKFSHTGFDDDFKLKSYDLLVDLSHLLKIFYELDNPLVKIKKIHTRRNFQDFISVSEFVDYFELLSELKPRQARELKSEIENFESEFLNLECGVDYICYEMIQEMPRKITEFLNYVNQNFKGKGFSFEFSKLNKSKIDALLKDDWQRETIEDCYRFKDDHVKSLEKYFMFLTKYEKHLPSIRKELKIELNSLKKNHGQNLKLINEINNRLWDL